MAGERKDVTQSAEAAAAAERTEDRVAELDATIFRWWARRREEGIKAGRAFNELKKILGHGKWQHHFAETFAPRGISLRTAERYMRLASEADAVSKSDNLSTFKPATDRGAQEIKEATKQAEADVGAASGHNKLKKAARLYKLPLHMTEGERNAMDALRKSSHWPRAERKIVCLLRQLCVKYGVVDENDRGRS